MPNISGNYVLQLIVKDDTGNDSAPSEATLAVVSAEPGGAESQFSTPTPPLGTNVVFTSMASNAGPSARLASTSRISSEWISFVSANAEQGSYSDTTGSWAVGALTAGASATLTITATVLASGNYDNTASPTASTPTDNTTANNSASVQ